MEHEISVGYTNLDESWRKERLQRVIGFLQARLSPIDFRSITNLHDHIGCLEVDINMQIVNRLDAETNKEQYGYIKDVLTQAWESQNEYAIEFTDKAEYDGYPPPWINYNSSKAPSPA